MLQKTLDEETGGIFRDTWRWAVASNKSPIRVNEQPYKMNFEASLKSEALYFKRMENKYDRITKRKLVHKEELEQSKLLHLSKIPETIGHTNHGSILKNKKPAV